MTEIVVNGRYQYQNITGVQRYATEIVAAWQRQGRVFSIEKPTVGLNNLHLGLVWEQLRLPKQCLHGKILWSPTNSGPVNCNRQVVTIHDGAVLSHPEWFSNTYARWRQWLLPRLMRSATHIITVSNFSKLQLCKHGGVAPEKITVIHPGVNHQHFYPKSADSIDLVRKKYALQNNYIFALSTMDPRKNLPRLLSAWAKISHDRTDLSLVIAGGNSAHFPSESTNKKTNNVQWLGRVAEEDLPALYSGAEGFIFPSLFEGFGLPPLEAMACGTPVIASNTTALPEVTDDAAIAVNPADTRDILAGLERLINDENIRTALCKNGLERSRNFTWENTAEKTWQLIQNL